ncbi:MAG: homoserine O-succinyltransferase [Chitinispirillia bacterium]|nr:homoserine O-succinyltransferase [Chitinispirillia bacterium]MCL2268096.1 homoserine O-succinyltransferase [Chitinispirillia bacterium]
MTIVVPRDYHAKAALESRQVQCVSNEDALREDIRALRVGILNIMPRAETYEFSLLQPLGRSVLQIEPVWIKLKTHNYNSSDRSHLDKLYVTFEEAVARSRLDGLILTGAPVEEIPFEDVVYWEEIKRILKYARKNVTSTLGICWGGLALAKYLGIDKTLYDKKIFGVYKTVNLKRGHTITGEMDDWFWCAQSRHSGINDAALEQAQEDGSVQLLAHADGAGYIIFESADSRFLIHLGHPEYDPGRLVEEYRRDAAKGRTDVDPPKNVDLDNPVNLWRSHRTEFFTQWIKYLHESTSY